MSARRRRRRARKDYPVRGCPPCRRGSAGFGRWHGPCRARRKDGPERTRSDGRPCCGRATGRVWSHKRGSPYGLASSRAHRPDVVLTNPVLPPGRKLPAGLRRTARRPTLESSRFSVGRMSTAALLPCNRLRSDHPIHDVSDTASSNHAGSSTVVSPTPPSRKNAGDRRPVTAVTGAPSWASSAITDPLRRIW